MSLKESAEEKMLEMLSRFAEKREPREEYNKEKHATLHKSRWDRIDTQDITIIYFLYYDEIHGYKYYVKGNRGIIYVVLIGNVISCTCPDYHRRGGHCKHILYVLYKEIQADRSSDIYSSLSPNNELLEQTFENYHPPLCSMALNTLSAQLSKMETSTLKKK